MIHFSEKKEDKDGPGNCQGKTLKKIYAGTEISTQLFDNITGILCNYPNKKKSSMHDALTRRHTAY
jgi:hypothetical protein